MEISREIKLLISKYQFKPKDFLGQNFLIASSGLEYIANVIRPKKEKNYIEIGAGFLTLTKLVSKSCNKVYAIEKDKSYISFYKDFIEENPETNIHIYIEDILNLPLSDFDSDEIYGNIPYNISSDIIVMISKENKIKRSVLLLQKEFADRILAKPSTHEYGAITVLVDLYFEKKFHKNFPQSFFFPRPSIESTLLELTRKRDYKKSHEELLSFIRKSFSMRRKKIINNIKGIFPEEEIRKVLLNMNINEGVRAEELSCSDFLNIFSALNKKYL